MRGGMRSLASAILGCALAAVPAPGHSSGEVSATAWNDTTLSAGFGQGGIVRLTGWTSVLDTVELSDGGLLVRVQHMANGGIVDLDGVVRLRADGSLDTSFGATGPNPGSIAVPAGSGKSVLPRTNGSFLLSDGVVRQYTAAGDVDLAFGVRGTTNTFSGAVFELDDGSLMLSNVLYTFALYRYSTDGVAIPGYSLDTSLPSRVIAPVRMVDGGWRVAVAGDHPFGGPPSSNVVSLTADGSLDLSFGGGDGIAELADDSYADIGPRVLLDALPDGRLATSFNTTGSTFSIVRLTATGELDVSVEPSGRRFYNGELMSLDLDSDGTMTLGVTQRFDRPTNQNPYLATVMRAAVWGDPDVNFNRYGWTPGSVWLAELGVAGFSLGGTLTSVRGGAVIVSTTQYDPTLSTPGIAQLTRLQLPPHGQVPSVAGPATALAPAFRLRNAQHI